MWNNIIFQVDNNPYVSSEEFLGYVNIHVESSK